MNVNIRTLTGNDNYGNKLQHFALQTAIEQIGFNVESTKFYYNNIIIECLKNTLKLFLKKRYRNFYVFDRKIKYSKEIIYKKHILFKKKYDFYVVGSDQVWNTTFDSFNDHYLLDDVNSGKKISYAASFGIDKVIEAKKELFKTQLSTFNHISVREDAGKKIIEDLTSRNDIEILVDPTMLLTIDRWESVMKKPQQYQGEKYILCYFLGDISYEISEAINVVAKERHYKIINLLDKNDLYYTSGPSEFLWLEKNAELICTDSFHSSVFGFLFNKPFVVFERVSNGNNMYSRIETLLSKFKLQNRKFDGKCITKENLNHDYTESYKILEEEKKKSIKFLKESLKIE